MRKIFLSILLTAATITGMHAQMPKEQAESTPYYIEATEAIQNDFDIDRASTLLEKELQVNPTNGYAALKLGTIYLLSSNQLGAISSLSKAAKTLPKSDKESIMSCYIFKGMAFQMMEDEANALKCYQQAKKISPNEGRPYLLIAELYKSQGDSAKAAQTIAEALKKNPKNVEIHEELAKQAAEADQHREAIEHLSIALEADSTNYDLLSMRAIEYLQAGNAGDGADDILDGFEYWLTESLLSERQDGSKLEAALEVYIEYEHKTLLAKIKERKIDSDGFPWNSLERIVYAEIPDRKAALAYFQSEYKKEDANVGKSLAKAYYDNGLYSKALEIIEENRDSSANESDYNQIEIDALLGLGEKEKLFNKLNTIPDDDDQNNVKFHSIRSTAEYYDGNMEDALAAINKAIEDENDADAKILLMRGAILHYLGRQEEAKKDFNKILEKAEEGEDVEERDKLVANAFLSNANKAEEIITTLDIEDNEDLRAMAQAKAIQGQYNKALFYLQQLKDNGYPHYKRLDRDIIFQPLRARGDYQQLMEDWKAVVGE